MSKPKNPKQEHPFLSAFLFTENGKPKSSLMIYTFCLSFVFLAIYALIIFKAIDLLSRPLESVLAPALNNALVSLLSGLIAAGICCVPHFLFRDKRLVFGAHLWLALYVLAGGVVLLISAGTVHILLPFVWMALLPAAIGVALSFLLYRRDHHPESDAVPEPEWKKYVNRR